MAYVGLNSIVPMLGVNPTILWLPNIVIILASAVIYISCHTHNWQLCSPVPSPPVGLKSVKYLFIAGGGLLCPGNVPGHAGEETRSYGLQPAATATLHQLHTRDGEEYREDCDICVRDTIPRLLTNAVLNIHLA